MKDVKRTRTNAGETLVEVMVSVVIFLMMMGILQGAILYSRAALEKSRQMRAENEAICEALRKSGNLSDQGASKLTFQAVSADGKTTGNTVFKVEAQKKARTVTYEASDGTQKSTTFYLYQPEKNAGSSEDTEAAADTGGDSP